MRDVVCGYYGKLPVSPEFLRLHASGPELQWLDEWLQQGSHYAKAQERAAWAERIAQASPYAFFFVPAHGGRAVYGAILASQDKAGRAFPFLSYALLDRHDFALTPWLIPVATADFIHGRTMAIRRLHEDLNWETFRRTVEDQMAQEPDFAKAREMFDRFMQSTTVQQWWQRDATEMSEATQLAVAHVLGRVAQVQCHGPKGVRMPIGREETCGNLDLAFWLQVHLQHQDGTAHSDVGLFCFWKREPSHGTALLSIGPGSPNSLRLLVNPEAQDDAWWDVVASIPDQVRAKAEGTAQPPTINMQDSLLTVAQLLRRYTRRTEGPSSERDQLHLGESVRH